MQIGFPISSGARSWVSLFESARWQLENYAVHHRSKPFFSPQSNCESA